MFVVLIAILVFLPLVSAAEIFSDGFESGNLNAWNLTTLEINWSVVQTDPFEGTSHAEVSPSNTNEPASVMQVNISTSGYENITFRYYRKLIGLDGVDEFQAEWFTGASWIILEQTGGSSVDDANYVFQEFNLSSSANDNSGLQIKFECTAGAVSEFCRVDNVTLLGNVQQAPSDNEFPLFSGFDEEPDNGTAYSSGAKYEFNTTIINTNGTAGIEFNGVNYSASNSSSVFNFSVFNLAAGDYSYYWFGWGNGSSGNYNASSVRSYTVSKASQTAVLSFNESSPINFGTLIEVGCNGELFRDDINVTGEIDAGVLLGAGSYDYSCKPYESQNYSYDDDNQTFVVNQIGSEVNLKLNGTEGNITIVQNSVILLNGSLVTGDSSGRILLYNNGNLINNATLEASNLTTFNSVGEFNITVMYGGSQNYTASLESYFVNVTKGVGIAPNVSIIYPSYASTYRETNLSLNFSVIGSSLDSCWYSIDDGETNNSIGCINTTFEVSGSGGYNLSLYVNESVEGLFDSESTMFYVNQGKPTIHLLLPNHNNVTNVSQSVFSYIPYSNVSVSSCSLFGNFNGSYGMNQTDNSVGMGENLFNLNLTEGNYNWAVQCLDDEGKSAITGNRTLNVDFTAPVVSEVNVPSGTVGEGEVDFEYNVSDDSPTTCTFTINTTSSGTIVYSNTSECDNVVIKYIVNLISGSYASTFRATDSVGNVKTSSVLFAVAGSITGGGNSGGGSSGGGGGGSSGNVILLGEPDLEILNSPSFNLRRGESTSYTLEVRNSGGKFANLCNASFEGEAASWFSGSGEQKSIGAGEIEPFVFDLNIPNEAQVGVHSLIAKVDCSEVDEIQNFLVELFVNDFEVEIGDYERDGNNLRVMYNVKEFAGVSHDIKVEYNMVDLDGIVRYNGELSINLGANEELDEAVSFDLPKDSFGEFDFRMRFNDGKTEIVTNREIFLPSGEGLTGLVISDENRRTLSIVGIVLLGGVILFFAWRFIRKHHRKVRGIGERRRGLIELEL